MMKTGLDQTELINLGTQTDELTIYRVILYHLRN